jgi:uncharacterized protein
MKFLVLSDIHENFHNLLISIQYANKNNIVNGLVLGDLINPGILHHIGKSKINFTVILGNNDGDIYNLSKTSNEYPSINLFNKYSSQIIGNKKVFLIHDNFLAQLICKSQEFDFVFCGHNHKAIKKTFGKSILINPGELSGHMYGKSTFGIWDSESSKFTLISIKNSWINVKKYKYDPKFKLKNIIYESTEL